jgi:AraC-like DNA-binding protein
MPRSHATAPAIGCGRIPASRLGDDSPGTSVSRGSWGAETTRSPNPWRRRGSGGAVYRIAAQARARRERSPTQPLASCLRASWMEARVTKVARVSAGFSKSLARRRFRPSQEKVRSTTQRRGRTTKALLQLEVEAGVGKSVLAQCAPGSRRRPPGVRVQDASRRPTCPLQRWFRDRARSARGQDDAIRHNHPHAIGGAELAGHRRPDSHSCTRLVAPP